MFEMIESGLLHRATQGCTSLCRAAQDCARSRRCSQVPEILYGALVVSHRVAQGHAGSCQAVHGHKVSCMIAPGPLQSVHARASPRRVEFNLKSCWTPQFNVLMDTWLV